VDLVATIITNHFKAFPDLWSGTVEEQLPYLKKFASHPQGLLTIVQIDDTFAGMLTSIPLSSNVYVMGAAHAQLLSHNLDPTKYFYYAEGAILPQFRRNGLLKEMFAAQEELMCAWGFEYVSFLSTFRPPNHPLRPAGYEDKDPMWSYFGFKKTDIKVRYHWPTIQLDETIKEDENESIFWHKELFTDSLGTERS